ncbi:phosphoglycerate mutase family protein [Pyrenophora teres f. maculata]|nr:phosphoglycerate mutase family protein [Pyrenophora teres f. maculata]
MLASSLLYSLLTAASSVTAYHHVKSINHTVITGIFQQDDPATNPSTFNFTASNFGLINRTYPSDSSCPNQKQSTQWQRLAHYITTLNQKAPKNEQYTLFFLGRHGQGFHNAAESYFGTPAWNCYWSERDGNTTVTWADAKLTETGKQQALGVNAFWNHLIVNENITPPQTFYTSPLYRCLDTARLSFEGVKLPHKTPFVPIIKEFLREGISAHTCDRRHSKSYIRENFPGFRFEKGFAEDDPYWTALYAEPQATQDARSKAVLDDIVSTDKSTYISITSHSGEIASLLRVLSHRPFSLSTGSAIPVLVKSITLNVPAPPTITLPYTPQKTCAAPPTIRDSSCNDCSCCT